MSESEYGDQYEVKTLLRRVVRVPEPQMRRQQIHRHLFTVDALTAARHLQEVLALALGGEADAREVLFAFAEYCLHASSADLLALEAVNLEARRAGLHGVGWLLLEPAPARALDPTKLRRPRGRIPTLGERRAAAAGWDPTVLERLTYDHDPMVIDRLCGNSRLLEQHLLAIVTRRPTSPEMLLTVARHSRWYMRPVVREALVLNPYGPTGLSLRTLPLLPAPVVDAARHAGELHATVRNFSHYLSNLRDGGPDGPAPGDDGALPKVVPEDHGEADD